MKHTKSYKKLFSALALGVALFASSNLFAQVVSNSDFSANATSYTGDNGADGLGANPISPTGWTFLADSTTYTNSGSTPSSAWSAGATAFTSSFTTGAKGISAFTGVNGTANGITTFAPTNGVASFAFILNQFGLKQAVTLSANTNYVVNFSLAERAGDAVSYSVANGGGLQNASAAVVISNTSTNDLGAGGLYATSGLLSNNETNTGAFTTNGFTNFSFSFNTGASGFDGSSLYLISPTAQGQTIDFTNVSIVAAIPEPSSYSLAIGSLIIMGVFMKRKGLFSQLAA